MGRVNERELFLLNDTTAIYCSGPVPEVDWSRLKHWNNGIVKNR